MTEMEKSSPKHTSKFGVAETIGVVAAVFQLVDVIRKIIDRLNQAKLTTKKAAERKATVSLLIDQLGSIIQEHKLQPGTAAPAGVEDRLALLVQTAEELLKSVSSGTLKRVKGALVYGRFKTRVEELRTGITDIGNALRLQASSSSLSPYQAGSALSTQHHQAPAPAPAPAQIYMQVNIVINQPCPTQFHMSAAQAPGVAQSQVAYQSAPMSYPSVGYPPVGHPSVPYPPVGCSSVPYPPIGYPAYGCPLPCVH